MPNNLLIKVLSMSVVSSQDTYQIFVLIKRDVRGCDGNQAIRFGGKKQYTIPKIQYALRLVFLHSKIKFNS